MSENDSDAAPPRDTETITSYHAHVYYEPASRGQAEWLREKIAERFPEVKLGRWHDVPIGPHPRAMYQVAFPTASFSAIVPWLMLNRRGLAVLLHPETGDERADHSRHAIWFGEVLPLRLEIFGAEGA